MYQYKSNYFDGITDLILHINLFFVFLYLTYNYKNDYLLSSFMILLNSLMFVRTFIIFHDCCHNSYLPNKKINYYLGSFLGIFCFTPFCWSYDHLQHHLTSGNKENKLDYNFNETTIHTLKEYKNMKYKKLYKFLKHPIIFFGIMPFIKFVILNRFFTLIYKYNNHPYKQGLKLILIDTVFNNIGLMIFFYLLNILNILNNLLISVAIGTSIGFMLFHNQHTFNPGYVVSNKEWNKKDSGLLGSSFIQIPFILKYFTASIEYHHIHHMNASIPSYKLKKYHQDNLDQFKNVMKLTLKDCYNNLWLNIYDEDNNKYIQLNYNKNL